MNLKEFFDQNRENLEIYDLKPGHEKRFLVKLKQQNRQQKNDFVKRHYKKLLIAASFILLIFTGARFYINSKQNRFQDTEIQQNERYFSEIIKEELSRIKTEETPETREVFENAMQQITRLENDYKKLVKDYRLNHDKYILNAMIENFQQRIEILQFVKQEINKIKKSKNRKNEIHKA